MNTIFRRILAVEISIALIVIIALLAGQSSQPIATPTNSTTPTNSEQSNIVDGCDSTISARTQNDTWTSAPVLDLKDKRKYWELETNCGQVIIEVYQTEAPISVNSLKFLTDQKYYDESPCHRLTASSFFVIQCGDPTGTGRGAAGYTIMEENLPATGANNYPAGTVALAKNTQPNSSGAQFFLVYQDTTLGPNYSIVGHVVKGLDIIKNVAGAGIVGGVKDGKPNQNFGIISAKFALRNTN
jgi:peptidyl-prolyl cis-trans isomerase B (cyclophilin B)